MACSRVFAVSSGYPLRIPIIPPAVPPKKSRTDEADLPTSASGIVLGDAMATTCYKVWANVFQTYAI
eukprot:CAMPEP_0197639888 /NCGR_PEP_ID=MMETSP1338-20131121/14367_1 /TAXON_ID=43686 ORGANISM="Pelagodinium beii, Strain RCC1491" /NCGR_SAMPLE_ID=MMETSP1338 /ASSEMBLY_ACC=CAM_ASM_000754 /LENGTH=66 /DNA_ID=CAMNT_0043212669 /DNA_START=891 /DNA_END=1088 /DNA_ORIENTATION=-